MGYPHDVVQHIESLARATSSWLEHEKAKNQEGADAAYKDAEKCKGEIDRALQPSQAGTNISIGFQMLDMAITTAAATLAAKRGDKPEDINGFEVDLQHARKPTPPSVSQ